MTRTCTTCQHIKRPEIDRCLAAGEPAAQVARDYDLNPSSAERLIQRFDDQPDVKARIAQALLEFDDERSA